MTEWINTANGIITLITGLVGLIGTGIGAYFAIKNWIKLVKEKNVGFVVNPYDISSIKNLFSNIYDGTVNMEEIKENMKKFHEKETTWETDFQKLKSYLEWITK